MLGVWETSIEREIHLSNKQNRCMIFSTIAAYWDFTTLQSVSAKFRAERLTREPTLFTAGLCRQLAENVSCIFQK